MLYSAYKQNQISKITCSGLYFKIQLYDIYEKKKL